VRAKGFIFDLDGTVYLSERLIPGADRTIAHLRRQGGRVCFLSNKALQTRGHYAAKLTRLGIPTQEGEVINSSLVMVRYLQKRAPGARLFVLGELPLVEELQEAGFSLCDDPAQIQWVIASFDRTFDYRKVYIACQALWQGARFAATNPDRTCPVAGGELPDCAGVIAHLEAVTLRKVEAVVGKPSPYTIEAILELLDLPPEDCLLVGDRIETDIRMGREAGMQTALVMTGVTTEAILKASPYQPDYVLPDIAALPTLL
jgi:NagD protein